MIEPSPTVKVNASFVAADKKRGMTVDEIGVFLQAVHRLNVSGNAVINAHVGWRGQITEVRLGNDHG